MANTTNKQDQTIEDVSKADRVTAALARAKSYSDSSAETMGTLVGLPEGHKGYWFVPAEVGEGVAGSLRRDLLARGYDLAPHASVAGVGNAEVWELHPEVSAVLAVARLKRDRSVLGQPLN